MIRRLCQILGSLCLLGASLPAQTLYGVTGSEGVASSLYTVNITNGATTLVGSTGFSGVGSLAFNPSGATLYGVANVGHRLIAINTSTGVGTAVSANATGTGNIADIAFRSDGTLFAAGGGDPGSLYTINTTTGVATLVGVMTNSSGGNALAFNSAGTLLLSTYPGLYTVNPATGATTQVTMLNFGSFASSSAFAGMKFHPGTGVLFGTTIGQLGTVSSFSGTQSVTLVGDTGVALEALAFGAGSTPPPPQPSTVPVPPTLLLLGTGLASGMGWRFLHNRRAVRK